MIDFTRPTALYGGSFDPIHLGHIHVAQEVKKQMPFLTQIFFVPAYISPGKKHWATPGQRLHWLENTLPPLGFGIWNFEMENNKNEPSYTIETLKEAHRQGAKKENLYLIIGSDSYQNLPHWKNSSSIRQYSQILVVNRPGAPKNALSEQDTLLEIPPHPASSTLVRKSLTEGKIPVDYLPSFVANELSLSLNNANPYARDIKNGK